MEKIRWDQSFSVGVAKLDEQHRHIIDMINLLIENVEPDIRSEPISETLTRMTKYAEEHFETEEQLLAQHAYPELLSHKEEHAVFCKKTAAFCLDTMRYKTSVPEEILLYLNDWWTNHILTIDMRYSSFFKERNIT